MSEIQIITTFAGLFTGCIFALTGAGGGIIALPLLIFLLDISPQQAAPIVLITLLIASSISAVNGLRSGTVRYRAALLMAGIGMFIAPIGVYFAYQTPSIILKVLLMLILAYVAYNMWRQAQSDIKHIGQDDEPACAVNPVTSRLFWTASCTKRLLATGAAAGFLSGLLGVGGGFFIVPSLYKVSNLDNQNIVNTSLAVIALIAISSVLSYWQSSAINWHIAIPFIISTTIAMLGLHFLHHQVPKHLSKQLFALLSLCSAILLASKL